MTSQRAEAGELERTRLFAKMAAQLFTFETEPDEDSAALNALSGLCLPPNLRTATDTWRRGARCSTSGGHLWEPLLQQRQARRCVAAALVLCAPPALLLRARRHGKGRTAPLLLAATTRCVLWPRRGLPPAAVVHSFVRANEQNDHTYTRRRAASALSLRSRVTRTPYLYFHGTQRIGRFCAEFIASARLTSASGCDCGTAMQQPPGR